MFNLNVTNIASIGREIYVWHRTGKTLSLFKDKNFFPYFYQISPTGIYKTIDNKKVDKIVCARPSDLSRRKDENSYEADVSFTKRYVIDKITSFGKADLKYSFVDIEVLADEMPDVAVAKYPISCISIYNSITEKITSFYLGDYDSEKTMLDDFVLYIKREEPDVIMA